MIYEMQWNSKRDKKLWTLQDRKPFGDDNIFKRGEHNFYQFKFETQSTPKQQDCYNCSLASAICMMQICKALHRIDISSSWIDKKSKIPRAIIPYNLFPSISYNISDPNHLLYVRMDFIKVLDKLQLLQQKAYNKQKPMIFGNHIWLTNYQILITLLHLIETKCHNMIMSMKVILKLLLE